jgi:hydrogenase-4 component E
MTLHNLTPGEAVAGTVAMALMIVQLGLLRSVVVVELITIYAIQSLLVGLVCFAIGVIEHAWDLMALGIATIILKVIVLPIYMRIISRGISSRIELPARINVTLSLLIAAALMGTAILTAAQLPLQTGEFLPKADLATALAIIFTGFLVAILRPNALAQVIAFMTLENGLFFGTVTLAPGMPFIVGILILLDVLVALRVFAILFNVLVAEQASARTHPLQSLRG